MLECSNCGFPAAVGPLGLNCLRCSSGLLFRRKNGSSTTSWVEKDLAQKDETILRLSSELTTLRAR